MLGSCFRVKRYISINSRKFCRQVTATMCIDGVQREFEKSCFVSINLILNTKLNERH